jgi:hypothetical protein
VREEPSQAPPHADPSVAQCVRAPCGAPTAGAQVPNEPATSQASHWPSQAASQQTPSTQKPLAHWPGAPQAPPFGCFGTQTPPEHQFPGAQEPPAEQAPAQTDPLQAYAPQSWVWAGGQLPAPVQLAARVATPPEQEASRHAVSGPG